MDWNLVESLGVMELILVMNANSDLFPGLIWWTISPLLTGRAVCQWVRQCSWNLFDMIVNVVIVKRSLKKKNGASLEPQSCRSSEKSNMRNNFPLLVSFLKMEMNIVMRWGMLCWRWWVTPERWGRGGGGKGWLLITDIQNISTQHKAGNVKTSALFYASRYFSWGCCVVLRAGRVCPGMFSLWEPNISWFITSSSLPGQISLPLLLSRIFLKTPEISFRFLTANNVRELQRRAPPVSIELSKT